MDYFIEGHAARAGTTLRIGVRLVRAGDQTQIWAHRYERELGDVLKLQGEVAGSIAREVAVALTPERRAGLDARTAIDPEAFEHYLKGRYFWGKRTEEGLTRGRRRSSRPPHENIPRTRPRTRASPIRTLYSPTIRTGRRTRR